jgi:hypothetical protein
MNTAQEPPHLLKQLGWVMDYLITEVGNDENEQS